MATCSVCKVELAPVQVLYDASAAIVCQSCLDKAEVKSLEARAASSSRKAAYGNLFIGVFSLFFNPFFLLTIGAIGNAIYVFNQLEKDRKSGEFPADAGVRKGLAVAGAVFGVISIFFHMALAARRARGQ
jgi:hypothetical protein